MAVIHERVTLKDVQLSKYVPTRILEIELSQNLPSIVPYDKTGSFYQRALCLIRLHTQPLGLIEINIDKDEIDPEEYIPIIWQALSIQINQHLIEDGLPPITEIATHGLLALDTPSCVKKREDFLSDAPFVSIVVPTHDRQEQLADCLASLMKLYYPFYEIIVVDNAPSTNATEEYIIKTFSDESKVHYICESRPGPSWARNCGIMATKSSIIAFVDDDVIVDPYWLIELVRTFRCESDIVCVTGLVLPIELETPAQNLFEEYGGFNKGFVPRIFKKDMDKSSLSMPLYPYMAGRFGTGASMAFTTAFLKCIGGFDPALGGSGPSRNGQDIAVFYQVIARGHKLAYQPRSVLYHLHRKDYQGLQKQIYNYGVGLTAFLMKCILENPLLLFDLIAKLPYGFYFVMSSSSLKNSKRSKEYPKELKVLEWRGLLYGPLAYLISRWKMSKFFFN